MRQIDVKHRGLEKVIACFEVDGILVDPGPESCLDTLLEALGGERPKALLLTHIHFDHAGASGALVRRWPDLDVYVHERGAPHMANPEKLVASAARLYGGEEGLRETWGEVVPVPEERPARSSPAASPYSGSTCSTRPATPPTTSATSTRTAASRSWATWPACGSRRRR